MERDPHSESQSKQDDEQKRESGAPGGGKGRRDEVGRSGVYPMSGPHPEGNVEIKGQASWGQGERGAAGYEDHGTSEMTYANGQVLGALDPNDSSASEPGVQEDEVPRDQWSAFVVSFSREHEGWRATVETGTPQGKLVQAEERPLEGISMDHADGKCRVYVQLGDSHDNHLTHTVADPTRMLFRHSADGKHLGLRINSADGTTTLINFKRGIRPESLDGIAA